MLNLGCGATFHPAWTNVDVISTSPAVKACDLRKPFPFDNEEFDVVYHSHVLEHFSQISGLSFMREAARVLKRGGIMRVVIPDLERIARLYLEKLEAAIQGKPGAEPDYDWMMIELLDQTVRRDSGGLMKHYLGEEQVPNLEFIRSRIGAEVDGLLPAASGRRRSLLEKVASKSAGQLARLTHDRLLKGTIRVLGGSNALERYREGAFRDSGEIHQWMYDRFSLARLMLKVGLGQVKVESATTSRIAGFSGFGLDDLNGVARKPDSLFMEGVKL